MSDTNEVTYVMQRSGATRGSETGRTRSFSESDRVTAPKGEFSHLPDTAYETRPGAPGESTDLFSEGATEAPWSLGEHTGAGYYELLYGGETIEGDDGEPVTVGQGEDEARAAVDNLNEKGLGPDEHLSAIE